MAYVSRERVFCIALFIRILGHIQFINRKINDSLVFLDQIHVLSESLNIEDQNMRKFLDFEFSVFLGGGDVLIGVTVEFG